MESLLVEKKPLIGREFLLLKESHFVHSNLFTNTEFPLSIEVSRYIEFLQRQGLINTQEEEERALNFKSS